MKSRIKILSGIIALSLVFIAGIEAKTQEAPKWIVLKKKGWVRALYFAEEDKSVVEAFNLTISDSIDKGIIDSLMINVDFQVSGKRVAPPDMVHITIDSQSRKRKFLDGRLLTIYSGGRKIELTATRDVWRSGQEGYVFESASFLISYAPFRELVKEKNIKMRLDGAEFEAPGPGNGTA